MFWIDLDNVLDRLLDLQLHIPVIPEHVNTRQQQSSAQGTVTIQPAEQHLKPKQLTSRAGYPNKSIMLSWPS